MKYTYETKEENLDDYCEADKNLILYLVKSDFTKHINLVELLDFEEC